MIEKKINWVWPQNNYIEPKFWQTQQLDISDGGLHFTFF